MINILNVINICTEPAILKIILFVQTILKYVFIIIPIGVILMTSLDLFKNVIASKEDDMKKNTSIVIKRFIYCVVIFLVPTIVNFTLDIVNDVLESEDYNYFECFENTENIAFYEGLAAQREEEEEEEIRRQAEEARLNVIEEEAIITTASSSNNSSSNNSSSNSSSGTGSFVGQRYNLTDEQLIMLTKQCVAEQGNDPIGAAAEASLMANLFELNGSNYGEGGDGLYNYVFNGGWFNTSHASSRTYSDETLTAVKNVLVLGNRTLPFYIDEHDCIYCGGSLWDVSWINNDGIYIYPGDELLNRDNYKRDITIIRNRYGSEYTFYAFPTEDSDPFGYTIRSRSRFEEWTPN